VSQTEVASGTKKGSNKMSEAQNLDYLLDVKNLTTYFPITEGIVVTRPVAQVHAVENVTFGIRPGETLSLVG
jgi:ABC-type glutathione transport system ATPase component